MVDEYTIKLDITGLLALIPEAQEWDDVGVLRARQESSLGRVAVACVDDRSRRFQGRHVSGIAYQVSATHWKTYNIEGYQVEFPGSGGVSTDPKGGFQHVARLAYGNKNATKVAPGCWNEHVHPCVQARVILGGGKISTSQLSKQVWQFKVAGNSYSTKRQLSERLELVIDQIQSPVLTLSDLYGSGDSGTITLTPYPADGNVIQAKLFNLYPRNQECPVTENPWVIGSEPGPVKKKDFPERRIDADHSFDHYYNIAATPVIRRRIPHNAEERLSFTTSDGPFCPPIVIGR